MPRPKRMLLLGVSLAGASFLGWSIAASLKPHAAAQARRMGGDQAINQLLDRSQQQGNLTPEARRKLVEQLLAQGRLEEAQTVLQPLRAEQPRSLGLALLMADLRRLNGDSDGALGDLRQLLLLHPVNVQVLQLLFLVERNNGRADQALQDLQNRFNGAQSGRRLELGLFLADVQRQRGNSKEATQIYRQLAQESPSNVRPWLALALLKRDEGNVEAVQALLQTARRVQTSEDEIGALIDQLAVNWGLNAARLQRPRKQQQPKAADKP